MVVYKIVRNFLFGVVFVVVMVTAMLISTASFSAPPPPPPPPDPGGSDMPIGGSPIGGGVLILVALGVGYGARKVYNQNKRKLSE